MSDFVPIAFHVDYWDNLGWRDPFASKAWTARRYEYSSRWKSESVYTPGFVLDGREWRNNGIPGAGTDSPGVLKVSLSAGGAVALDFKFLSDDARPLEVHVARLGFDLSTNVKAGENSGRKLRHDFVVLSLNSAPMQSSKAQLQLPAPAGAAAASSRGAIAAWVTASGQVEPIQAVGGWLR